MFAKGLVIFAKDFFMFAKGLYRGYSPISKIATHDHVAASIRLGRPQPHRHQLQNLALRGAEELAHENLEWVWNPSKVSHGGQAKRKLGPIYIRTCT